MVSEVVMFPLPLVALVAVHEKVAVLSHEVKFTAKPSPEQMESGLGVATKSGAESTVMFRLGKLVTVFPQASVIVGLGTATEPEVMQ